MPKLKVEISARHVHLSESDFRTLFGEKAELKAEKDLSQKGEFASDKKVTLKNEENLIEGVRVLGPFRDQTQVEVSRTDAYKLKANVPLRLSGNLKGSAPIKLIGPEGTELELGEGMIVARRHLHVSNEEAARIGLADGQEVGLRVAGERGGQLDHCIVRIKPTFTASFHIDTDEANALGISGETQADLIF